MDHVAAGSSAKPTAQAILTGGADITTACGATIGDQHGWLIKPSHTVSKAIITIISTLKLPTILLTFEIQTHEKDVHRNSSIAIDSNHRSPSSG